MLDPAHLIAITYISSRCGRSPSMLGNALFSLLHKPRLGLRHRKI